MIDLAASSLKCNTGLHFRLETAGSLEVVFLIFNGDGMVGWILICSLVLVWLVSMHLLIKSMKGSMPRKAFNIRMASALGLTVVLSLAAWKFLHYQWWQMFEYIPPGYGRNMNVYRIFDDTPLVKYEPFRGDACGDWIFERTCISVIMNGENITDEMAFQAIDKMKNACRYLHRMFPEPDLGVDLQEMTEERKREKLSERFRCGEESKEFIYAVLVVSKYGSRFVSEK